MSQTRTQNRIAASARNASVQGVWTVLDQAVVSLCSFTASVIVGRELGEAGLGVFALGITVFWLAAGVLNAVAWVPYTARACRVQAENLTSYRANTTWLVAAMALMLGLGCLATWAVVSLVGGGPPWLAPLCLAMAPLCVTLMLREHVRRVAIAEFCSARLLWIDLPIGLLTLGTLAALAAWDRLTPINGLYVVAATAACALPVVGWFLMQTHQQMAGFRADTKASWDFGRWLLVATLAWLIGDAVLRALLVGMHSEDAFGVFSAAYAVVMLANPLILAATSFMRSWAARVLDAEGPRGLRLHTLRLSIVAGVLAPVAILLISQVGVQAVERLFDFQADITLVTLLSAAICLQAAAIPVEAAVTSLELGRRVTHVALVQLAFALLVGIPMVYLHGPAGIGWAMIARCLPLHLMYWETLCKHRTDALPSGFTPQANA